MPPWAAVVKIHQLPAMRQQAAAVISASPQLSPDTKGKPSSSLPFLSPCSLSLFILLLNRKKASNIVGNDLGRLELAQ